MEAKLWQKHRVRAEEVWDVLCDDEDVEWFAGRPGQANYIAVGRTRGGRCLFVAFYLRQGVADVATAYDY